MCAVISREEDGWTEGDSLTGVSRGCAYKSHISYAESNIWLENLRPIFLGLGRKLRFNNEHCSGFPLTLQTA
jgi:hypothetical protein